MSQPRLSETSRTATNFQWWLREAWREITRYGPTVAFATLLVTCWALGGATRTNMAFMATLELLAIGVLFVVRARDNQPVMLREARPLALMLVVFVAVAVLQLVPLPSSLWAELPGHGQAARGLGLLDLPKVAQPLSLAPEHTVSALLQFIPPVAIFMVGLSIPRRSFLGIVKWGAPIAGLFSTILGMAQAFSLGDTDLHIYAWTTPGAASGLFANVNHQATFLLMCLPFVAVIAARARSQSGRRGSAGPEVMLLLGGIAFALLIGIAMGGSLTGYILAPFVIGGCAMILPKRLGKLDPKYLAAGIALTLAAIAIALTSPRLSGLGYGEYFGGERARAAIHAHTIEAAVDFAPLGSGVGSFEKVYPLYEITDNIEPTYVNHAHNEYLEVLLELGLPGLGLMLVFLVWWGRETLRIWFKPVEFGSFQRMKMAACLSIAVVLIHSLVDYPIRTQTIACLVAACLAIIVRTRGEAPVLAENEHLPRLMAP